MRYFTAQNEDDKKDPRLDGKLLEFFFTERQCFFRCFFRICLILCWIFIRGKNEELSRNWYGCNSNKHAEWSANWIDMSFRATSAAVSTFHIIRRAQKEKNQIKHFKALTVEYSLYGSPNESKKSCFFFWFILFTPKQTKLSKMRSFIYEIHSMGAPKRSIFISFITFQTCSFTWKHSEHRFDAVVWYGKLSA